MASKVPADAVGASLVQGHRSFYNLISLDHQKFRASYYRTRSSVPLVDLINGPSLRSSFCRSGRSQHQSVSRSKLCIT